MEQKSFRHRIKQWYDEQLVMLMVLYLCCGDRRVPRLARILVLCVVAYALSPIDLIPDFIPVLGHLDDLIIIPTGIYIAWRLVPDEIKNEKKARAREMLNEKRPRFRSGAVAVIMIWVLVLSFIMYKIVYR